jgi:carboxylesterase
MVSAATIAKAFAKVSVSSPGLGDLRGEGDYGAIKLDGRAPGVLALHGFGATPAEVKLVAEAAHELGLRVHAPLLPGHGQHVRDLARTRWADWSLGAREAFEELAAQGGPVIVAGLSMGSLLTLELATLYPDRIAGILLLAPATRLSWPFPGLALALASALRLPDFVVPKKAPDIRDARQRRQQRTYSADPWQAGNEVRLAGQRLSRELGKVRCPAFIAHGAQDHICPVSNAQRVFMGLGTPIEDRELLILPRSFHVITRDVERALLRARIQAFLFRLAARVDIGAAEENSGAPAPSAPLPAPQSRPVEP